MDPESAEFLPADMGSPQSDITDCDTTTLGSGSENLEIVPPQPDSEKTYFYDMGPLDVRM